MKKNHAKGDLRVWWIPQVPGKSFDVEVRNLREARLLLTTLAYYDIFQFEHNIKPDYSNMGGLQVWSLDSGGGEPGWIDWVDREGIPFDDIPDEEAESAVWEEA